VVADFCSLSASFVQAAETPGQTTATSIQHKPIFSNGLPTGTTMIEEGSLSPKEGVGTYQIFSYPKSNIRAVIVSAEKLSWLKVTQLKSANPLIVSRHILTRFFPTSAGEETPTITRHDGLNFREQVGSHLLITTKPDHDEPAITLRILFPKGRVVFLLMRQSFVKTPDRDAIAASYQLQEGLAQQLMDSLYIPDTSQLSENLILYRLRRIFKEGVFTRHVAGPKP
jgi:hypothetical protein